MENCTLTSIELFKELDRNLDGFGSWTDSEIVQIKNIIQKRSNILDVGCGWGRAIKELSRFCDSIIGVDIDRKELESARGYLGETDNVVLSHQDATQLAFADNSFDVVVSIGNTFGNLSNNQEKVLAEMARLVVKGGSIFLSMFSKKATESRVEVYSEIGLDISYVKADKIYFSDGYISEGFDEKSLEPLFSSFGLTSQYIQSNEVGLFTILKT